MSWITDIISAGAKLLGRAVGLKPGPDVKPLPKRGAKVVFEHWYPPENSIQCWQAGPERCFYCLAHISSEAADKPCPRRRPDTVELA